MIGRRLPRASLALGLVLPLAAPLRSAGAQVPDTTRRDTVQARRDTLPAGQDTIRARPDSSRLQRYLAAEAEARIKVRAPEPVEPPGPEPAGSRIVLTRDSIEWGHAATVADLLQRVPGVYLWRGGWLGQPELPNFQGRGATSAEYYLDGLPFIAGAPDSVGVDPALFPLSLLGRIEIERWPGLLRVRLYTLRHDRLAPRSRIGISRGSRDFARYQASLERRTRSGLGFVLAGDNLTVPEITGLRTRYANTQLFAQGSYLPSPRWGVLAQVLRARPDRDPVLGPAGDTLSRGIPSGRRTDWEVRAMWRADTGAAGPRVDLLFGHSVASDSLAPSVHVEQIGATASYRLPLASLGASAFYRTRWTPLDLRVNGGWAPVRGGAVSGEAAYQRHDGGRSSAWVGLRGGVELPLGLRALGSMRFGSAVAAPALPADPAQRLRDWQALVGWERPWIGVEAGYARTAAFQPLAYQPYAGIPAIAPLGPTEWVTLRGRLTPFRWLSLEGWYSDPRGVAPDGIPPRHMLGTGTIRTDFPRIFPSGVLELELRLGVEHWEAGVLGRDAFGSPVTLPRATYFRSLVQIRLGSFKFFWDRSNLTLVETGYVPGLPIAGRPSEFGARWEFSN